MHGEVPIDAVLRGGKKTEKTKIIQQGKPLDWKASLAKQM